MLVVPQDFLEKLTEDCGKKLVSLRLLSFLTGQGYSLGIITFSFPDDFIILHLKNLMFGTAPWLGHKSQPPYQLGMEELVNLRITLCALKLLLSSLARVISLNYFSITQIRNDAPRI